MPFPGTWAVRRLYGVLQHSTVYLTLEFRNQDRHAAYLHIDATLNLW